MAKLLTMKQIEPQSSNKEKRRFCLMKN